jgi:hypothetical protein
VLYSNDEETEMRDLERIIEEFNLLYEFPDEVITSKEYWERYFMDNPDKKPKHIVYYS